MLRITAVGIVVIVGCGCISSAGRSTARYATVDDVTANSPFSSGYCVAAVDGKSVERARSATETVIPLALVDPGEHTLSLHTRGGETPVETNVTAVFEAGKRYRIKNDNGELSVVEANH